MGFFETARKSGAEAYGAARAEKYGRIAKFWRGVQLFMVGVLVVGILIVVTIGQGGGN